MADNRYAEAVDIVARQQAADAIKYDPRGAREIARKLAPDMRREVDARVREIEASLRPDNDLYEAAYDTLHHGVGVES